MTDTKHEPHAGEIEARQIAQIETGLTALGFSDGWGTEPTVYLDEAMKVVRAALQSAARVATPDARAAALEEALRAIINLQDVMADASTLLGRALGIARRALSPLPAAVTAEGWKLVPYELTGVMWKAMRGMFELRANGYRTAETAEKAQIICDTAPAEIWMQGLAAAPSAPAGGGKKDLDNPTTERSGT